MPETDISGFAIPPTARGFDDEDIAGIHFGAIGAFKVDNRAIGAFHRIAAQFAWLAASNRLAWHTAVVGPDRCRHRREARPHRRELRQPGHGRSHRRMGRHGGRV